jgi:antitoxin component YwqK of YwqJK toxin-antitoxin module
VHQDVSMLYSGFESVGNYLNGVKIGKWTDVTPNGIIYAENYYDSTGNPIGVWKINYPYGRPRRITEYNNLGINKWSMYRYNRKVGEVMNDSIISSEIYWKLNAFETNLFDQETNYTRSTSTVVDGNDVYLKHTYLRADPFEEIVKVGEILISNKFSGILIVWNSDNTTRRKCNYTHGSEYRFSYFYNRKKELTKQDEYRDNKIVRTVTFNKKGEEKIKTY